MANEQRGGSGISPTTRRREDYELAQSIHGEMRANSATSVELSVIAAKADCPRTRIFVRPTKRPLRNLSEPPHLRAAMPQARSRY